MTILDERELTDEERAAIADEPRPGVWIEEGGGSHIGNNGGVSFTTKIGDGRVLTQVQTDTLIACEIVSRHTTAAGGSSSLVAELLKVVGACAVVALERTIEARQQRGGIHSDPLVRMLAFRAWGDRDRTWFAPKPDDRGLVVLPDHPHITEARIRRLVGDLAAGHGVSIRRVVRDFRVINTNAEVTPVLDAIDQEAIAEERRREELERRARDFFRR